MSLDSEVHANDPADQLRADIESAIAAQETRGGAREEVVEETTPAETSVEADGALARERDEKGRFKAKGEEEGEPAAAEAAVEAKAESPAQEASKGDVRPPPGFSVASKAAWDALPQSVRDDIAKREQEIDNGFKRYAGLGKFAEEAERNGTSLQNAINDYASIEGALKQNFVGGIEHICQRLGVSPRQLAQVMAARHGVVATQAQQPGDAAVAPSAPAFDADALMRQFQQIARAEAEGRVQAMRAENERSQIDSQIAAFGADPKNKFFPNLRQDMAALVQAGKANSLQEAYEAACWLNPETRAILINETNGGRNQTAANAASRARNAAKAVGGSPSPGVSSDANRRDKNLSLDDEIRAAVDAQMGQI